MYSPELSYTFLRKWKKHNTIGALIDWDIKLKAGWIRTYSLKNKSYLRFTVYIKYRELDDEDIKFLEYFLYENRIIYKNKEILIAFKIPKIKISKISQDIFEISIKNIFLRQSSASQLCNYSNISFRYDTKVDTISKILEEFASDFLNDKEYSQKLCKILGNEMDIAYIDWKLKDTSFPYETIETIYI
tara:strand:- start:60 stop:623 length:564 start_codon:yes stop_codon:yes gene_type:complete